MNAPAKEPRLGPAIAFASPHGVTLRVIHGMKETCLAISLPRGAHFKTIVGYDLSAIGRDQLVTALLDWRYVDEDMPDDECRVMLACSGDTDEPVYGAHADGAWYNDEGGRIEGVYAWAHTVALPPQKKGGAS